MEKEVNKSFYTLLLVDIFLIVIGLLILIFKASTIRVISYVLGALLAFLGVFGIVRFLRKKDTSYFTRYGIVYGVAFLIIACLLLWKDTVIVKMLPFSIGMVMIISSTLRFDDILRFKSSKKEIWKVLLFLMILEFFFGSILTFRLMENYFSVYQEIAVFSVFFGILDLVSSWISKIEFEGFDLNFNIKEVKLAVKEKPQKEEEQPKIENLNKEEEKPKTKKQTSKKTNTKKSQEKKTLAKKASKKEAKPEEPISK